ncbi:hypothetical protein PV327_008703 [Microctonus hyperodae]|uniref:Serine/threonine-protein kinase 40 n=1 Tax=Microctonus hyperodae TaxID=165561 RepID=A0AA39F3N5_MICHY|nr:hypothetical protein PV327_008703 [Microctonus hyperodae]
MTNNIDDEVIESSNNNENTMENGYEPMDTSDETNNENITRVMSVESDQSLSLTITEPIDNDSYNMNIDVPYAENATTDSSTSGLINIDAVSTSNVELSRAMSLDNTNGLNFASVSICKPPDIDEINQNLVESRGNVRNNIETRINPHVTSNIPVSNSANEIQKVPEVGINYGAGTSQWKNLQSNSIGSWRLSKDDVDFNSEIPAYGIQVCSKKVKRAGPYILGPAIGTSPVKSIVQCLARKSGTDKYYTIKILTLKDDNEYETQDDRQGKMLLHAEYSLLSLLQNQDGVVHHHGFFKDSALGEKSTANGRIYTGKIKRRLCLVLDCLTSHDFNPRNDELLNLQHHVIKEKKLSEKESLLIFTDTVRIVAELHKRNIVHRDLKLGNLVLDRKSRKVTITNFCLGKHLASENDLLKDQRGSPAYISPDVLCGKPYLGKPSDMWALGVVLFTMLYGQFPFYDSNPTQLFIKIKAANYHIPNDGRVSEGTINLIRNLLVLQPSRRLTAVQVLESLSTIIDTFKIRLTIGEEEQVVPDIIDINKDESTTNEKKNDSTEKSRLVTTRPFTDLFKKISFQEQMLQLLNQSQSPLTPRPRPYSQIPVHRVDSDPRELTPAELERYKHLIPRENQRQHSHNSSRREGVMRPRAATRYRSSTTNLTQSRSIQNGGSINSLNNQNSNENSNNTNVAHVPSGSGTSNISARSSVNSNWTTVPAQNTPTTSTLSSSITNSISRSSSAPINLPSLNTINSVNGNNRTVTTGVCNSSNLINTVITTTTTTATAANLDQIYSNLNPTMTSTNFMDPAPLRSSTNSSSRSRSADSRARLNHARMAMDIRACLSSRDGQRNNTLNVHNINGIGMTSRSQTGMANRSVPDIESRNQQNRFREAILDRLMSFRTRIQRNRINHIEREIENVRNRLLSNSERNLNNNDNNRNVNLLSRRNSYGQNRHLPYGLTSLNYLTTNRNISNDVTSVLQNGGIHEINNEIITEPVINNHTITNFTNALQRLATRLGRSLQSTDNNEQIRDSQTNRLNGSNEEENDRSIQ